MTSPPAAPLRFIYWSASKPRTFAVATLAAVAAAKSAEQFHFYILKQLTDSASTIDVADPTTLDALWFWGVLYALCFLFYTSLWRCSGFCGMEWLTRTSADIYESLFQYLTGHSTTYFNDRFAGAISNKISNAASSVENLLARMLWDFMPLTIGIIGNLILLYTCHYSLTLMLAGWVAFTLLVNISLVRKLAHYSYDFAESSSELRGKIVDSTSNIEVVHHTGMAVHEQRYVSRYVRKRRKKHIKSWRTSEWLLVTNGVLLSLFTVSMIGLAITLLKEQMISIGTLVMVVTILVSLQRSLFFIGSSLTNAVGEYGQLKEGLEELLLPHDIVEKPDAIELAVRDGVIKIDSVKFAYATAGVFENFSLTIESKEKIGLVGVSGAGKSTLVSLLLRLHDLQAGKILIDGQDISKATMQTLKESVAFVPQLTSLFHRSIEDNIRYGRETANDDEVVEAAKLAYADEFIETLPDGYKTLVGERGVKLSGGQRQRIAVARAILRDAPILILDEATSALDSESEEAIQHALENLIKDKTVIAIAHRLSTLRLMDRIVVLEDGKIIEDGSHSELLEKDGTYKRLWDSQVSGFIVED